MEEIEILFDYFNLCAEEFLFYEAGYIDEGVWESWRSGMAMFAGNERIRQLWEKELKTKSYYGFNENCAWPAIPWSGKGQAKILFLARLVSSFVTRSGTPVNLTNRRGKRRSLKPPAKRMANMAGQEVMKEGKNSQEAQNKMPPANPAGRNQILVFATIGMRVCRKALPQ